MIEPSSLNVYDLELFSRAQSGRGGDGSDASIAAGLSAHHEPAEAGTRSSTGRDVIVKDLLFISGFDVDGDLISVGAHDLAQWTDHLGVQTAKLAIVGVAPFHEPDGKLSHLRIDIG